MPRLALYLLGAPRVELDGEELHIPRRKATALLAYLAMTGRAHQRDALATLLWPEFDQSGARAELRRMLSTLSRVLGTRWLAADRETTGLDPEAEVWLDVRAFREYLAACEARAGPPGEGVEDPVPLLEQAVALYRDDFLAGFTLPDSAQFDEWQRFQSQSLRDELASALERLAAMCGEQGAHDQAIAHARRWLSLDPLHEPAHCALMRLYARSGRRGAALRQFRQCVRILEEELGLSPAGETTALYERIRAERPLAAEMTAGPKPGTEAALEPPFVAGSLPAFLAEEELAERERPVFVAREPELVQLRGYLEAALAGDGGVAFVTGGAGRGKTALMAELARRATEAHPELLVATGNCNAYAGLGDPYMPFREILNALTGDVGARWAAGAVSREQARRLWVALPAAVDALLTHGGALLDTFLPKGALLSRAEAAAPDGALWLQHLKARFTREGAGATDAAADQLLEQVTAVLRALAAQHPLLLCLDDLQWVDAASAGLLFHLGRRLAGSRILIVGAYRPDEVALGRGGERHPLEQALAEFKRQYGDVWVDLREADEREGRQFVDAFLDSQPNRLGEAFRVALYKHTGGHPLFTVELLRAMQARGDLVGDEEGRWVEGSALHWERLPGRAEAVIEARIGRLPPELRELLAVASVEGEVFTAQVLAQVQGVGERQVLRALSQELVRGHRLVRQEGVVSVDGRRLARYRFVHALYQQYLYGDLGQGERALLHHEVAEALEALYAGHTDEIVPQLARHYAETGDAAKAIVYLSLAGDRARLAYAHQEAIEHYTRAVAFQEGVGDDEGAGRTLMKLGLVHHTRFDFAQAGVAFEEGFARWQRAGSEGSRPAPSPAPHALRMRWWDPQTLDPDHIFGLGSQMVARRIFRGLVSLDPDLDLVPELARSWEVLDGGCRYLFHLRRDARWSDGVPVTAHDFEYAWKRRLAPATGSRDAQFLYDIVGARAYHEGAGSGPDEVGARAVDGWTLDVELERPCSHFLYLASSSCMCPVPRHVVQRHGAGWTDLDAIVGNGPFKLVEWKRGVCMRLVRNLEYQGLFGGNVEEVELHLTMEPAVALDWYRRGYVDILPLEDFGLVEIDRLRREFAGECLSVPSLQTIYFGFDVSRPPFDDLRVRHAFALAIDRERLANVSLRGVYSAATGGLVPPGMPGHSPGIALPCDPDEARRLLVQAGYARGSGFPVRNALSPLILSDIGEPLREQWRENVGIDVAWEVPDPGDFAAHMSRHPSPLYLLGWVADWPDPGNFVNVPDLWEYSRWANQAYQALLQKARCSMDQDERVRVLQRADEILVHEAPIVPLVYGSSHVLIKPWIRRFRLSALMDWYLQDTVIEPH